MKWLVVGNFQDKSPGIKSFGMMKKATLTVLFLSVILSGCAGNVMPVDVVGGDLSEVSAGDVASDSSPDIDGHDEGRGDVEVIDLTDVSGDTDAVMPDAPDDADGENSDVVNDSADVDPVDVGVDVAGDVYDPGPWPAAAPDSGFRRHGRFILDEQSRAVLLHGINVSNYAKYAPDMLPWHTEENFRQLAAVGFDSIRLQTYWAAIMPQEGVIDEVYLDKYAALVEAAGNAGLTVIVDMHQDIFGVGFLEDGAPRWACDESYYASYVPVQPWSMNYLADEVQACFDNFYSNNATFDRFIEAWVAVADRVKDIPAVVGFDLLNEPNWGNASAYTFMRDIWIPRMEQLSEALLAAAPGRLVFMEPTTLSITLGAPELVRPTTVNEAVFAPHFYHPSVHEGEAYERATNYDLVELAVTAMSISAEAMGHLPVWVGEFGGPWNAGGFDQYMGDIFMNMYRMNAGWAVYSDDLTNDDGFGIRLADGSFKPDAIRILAHPRAVRVPGPVLLQEIDRDLKSYSLRFQWVADAALELWGGYPDGQLPLGPCVHVEGDDECAVCTRPEVTPAGLWSCERPLAANADAIWEVEMLPAPL
jgi:endoglycosylceramidase